jgi:hypothetical protein
MWRRLGLLICLTVSAACGGGAGHPDAGPGGDPDAGGGGAGVCPECPVCADIDDALVMSVPIMGYVLEAELVGQRLYVVEQIEPLTLAEVTIYELAADGTVSRIGTIATPGHADDLAVEGDHVFIADGDLGLQIADVSNPAAPTIIGSLVFNQAYGVDVEGDHAFVTGGSTGLRVIDVSDPTAPTLVGAWSGAPGPFHAVSVESGVAYVADFTGSREVYLIDVSNPTSPTLIGTLPDPPDAFHVLATGGVLHTANGHEVRTYGVSNPAAPLFLSSFEPTGAGPHYVWRDGTTMIVAHNGRGIDWVDLSDPSAPVHTATYRGFGNYSIAVPVGGYVVGGAIYDAMRVIDPAKAAASSWPTARLALPDDIAYGMATDGRHAFLARGYAGLTVVDLMPATPAVLATVAIPEGNGVDIAYADGRVYVAGGLGGLAVFDVADPASPALLSQLALDGAAIDVAAAGDWAFVWLNQATGSGAGGIDVVSVADPAAPSVVAHIDREFNGEELVLDNGYLYLQEGGLIVYDVRDPAHPALAADIPIYEFGQDVAVANGIAAVLSRRDVNEKGAVHLFDVTDPAAPLPLGSISLSSEANTITLAGHYAYVGEHIGLWIAPAIRIIDIADPANPRVVRAIDAEAVPSELAVIGPDVIGLLDSGAGDDSIVIHRVCDP